MTEKKGRRFNRMDDRRILRGGSVILVLLAAGPAFADSYTVGAGQTQVLSNAITDGAGPNSVSLGGGGMLILANPGNSYSGGTSVAGGSYLGIDNDSELGAVSGALALGDSRLPGNLSLLNTSALTSSRSIVLNAAGGSILANTNGPATFSGVISGSGVLTISGGGTVTLTGSNTYTGGTLIGGASTLQVALDSALGSTSGEVNIGDSASGGTLSWINTSAFTSSRNYVVGSGGADIILVNSAGAVTLSGIVSGTGALTVGGGGNLILTGANSYTGGTVVTSGAVLSVNADAALGVLPTSTTPTSGAVTLNNGTLQFNGGFTSARSVTLGQGGGALDTDGNSDTLTGVISGTGGLTKVGTGTLVLTGANSYTGGTIVSGGTLQLGSSTVPTAGLVGDVTVLSGATLSGAGTISGALLNNGTVFSGIGTNGLSVASLIQGSGSTLTIGMTPAGAGTLKVGGAASLAGTLSVSYGAGFYKPGTYALLTASSLSGAFSTISAQVPSVGLSANVIDQGNQIDLVLSQLSTLPNHPTIFPALTSVAVDDAQRASQTVLSHMVMERTQAMADNYTTAWADSHRVISQSPYGFWFLPTGNFGHVSASGGAPGFDTNGYGFMTGIDGELARGLTFGVAAGASRTNVDESGTAKGTQDVPRLAVYGSWWRGPIAVDGVVGYGYAVMDSTRPVGGTGETAKSSHHGEEFSASLQASTTQSLWGVAVSPAIGMKYLSLNEDRYTEKQADIYNYTVLSHNTNSLRPYVDAMVSHRFELGDHAALVPQASLGYESELMSTARNVEVMTAGDDYVWRIAGARESRGMATVDAGMTWETGRSQGFYLLYDREQGASVSAQTVSAGVRYRL